MRLELMAPDQPQAMRLSKVFSEKRGAYLQFDHGRSAGQKRILENRLLYPLPRRQNHGIVVADR